MRTILFRGKRLDNGLWVSSGNLIQFVEGREVFIPEADSKCMAKHDEETADIVSLWGARFRKVDPETVGQFTGLCDKTGQRIFEGDIVIMRSKRQKYAVEWRHGEFHFKAIGFYEYPYFGSHADMCEIIGNVYDNPELLEVKHDGI